MLTPRSDPARDPVDPRSSESAAAAEAQARLKSELSERYLIERQLGAGGMATVYLAHDSRHDRDVALKVLRPDLADVLGSERFLTEIKLCARLQHPHILTVLDSGETAGQLWFTMPYVEGESLRDRLRREKQLPIEEALRITREAALALDYAHRHGVVHRDIKPENILLSDQQALVADFGIGRAIAPGNERLTATGSWIGTPDYMSPEQAMGDRDVDARSDIYSLATVLYEMLAGENPFAAPSPQATIARRLTETARPLRVVRASVPKAVERAVAKALSRLPADRFATAADFVQPLSIQHTTIPAAARPASHRSRRRRKLSPAVATLGIGFLLGVGVLFAWRNLDTSRSGGGVVSNRMIAVLPFENVGSPADEYFADGVTDEIRGKLATLKDLRVIAGASSREYKRSSKSLAQIGRELGAEYLLVAKVRWSKAADGSNRVRVSPELVQLIGGTATTRWEQSFDGSTRDVFQVQGDIANRVATALDVALVDSVRRAISAAKSTNFAAYDAFLKGEAAAHTLGAGVPSSVRGAIRYFEQAVALDSAFADAWARLAYYQATLYFNSVPSPELGQKTKAAAERAERLAPGQPDGALALGAYYGYVALDNQKSLAALDVGLRVAPNDVDLLANAALAEESLGRWESALQHYARAAMMDPRSASAARRYARALIFLRQYPEAQLAADRALALDPSGLPGIETRVMVSLAQGDLPGARAVVRQAQSAANRSGMLAFFGQYQDLYWVLDDSLQIQLLTLPPSAFDDNRGAWAAVRAETYYLRGDVTRSREYADSASLALANQVRTTPDDAQRHVLLGLSLAYLGRKSEASREGERAAQLVPIGRDAYLGAYVQHQLARIYALTGQSEKAIDILEALLKVPYYLSPGWLRIDPEFTMLRGNPRYERLIAAQ